MTRANRNQLRWLIGLSLAGIAFWAAVSQFYMVALNRSHSLPQHAFLVHRGEMPGRGDFVAFYPGANRFYPDDLPFIKILTGLPGDEVRREGNTVIVAGKPVARLKPRARNGMPLYPGPVGRIPDEHYFVSTPHPDGLDSRYDDIGFVPRHRIIGKAYVLF